MLGHERAYGPPSADRSRWSPLVTRGGRALRTKRASRSPSFGGADTGNAIAPGFGFSCGHWASDIPHATRARGSPAPLVTRKGGKTDALGIRVHRRATTQSLRGGRAARRRLRFWDGSESIPSYLLDDEASKRAHGGAGCYPTTRKAPWKAWGRDPSSRRPSRGARLNSRSRGENSPLGHDCGLGSCHSGPSLTSKHDRGCRHGPRVSRFDRCAASLSRALFARRLRRDGRHRFGRLPSCSGCDKHGTYVGAQYAFSSAISLPTWQSL